MPWGSGSVAGKMETHGGTKRQHGGVAPVRTSEAPAERRLEEQGFGGIATVTLLMKETQVRVAEPSLVPAAVRQLEVTSGS